LQFVLALSNQQLPPDDPGYTYSVQDGETKPLDCVKAGQLQRELEQQMQQMH
jgi:hypothetical protein